MLAGGGLNLNTRSNFGDYRQSGEGASSLFSITAARKIGRFELGITGSTFALYATRTLDYALTGSTIYLVETRYYFARHAYAFTPILNYNIINGRGKLYSGVNIGCLFSSQKPNDNRYIYGPPVGQNGEYPRRLDYAYGSGTGLTAGAQVGYNYTFVNRFILGAELAGSFYKANLLLPAVGDRGGDEIELFYTGLQLKLGVRL